MRRCTGNLTTESRVESLSQIKHPSHLLLVIDVSELPQFPSRTFPIFPVEPLPPSSSSFLLLLFFLLLVSLSLFFFCLNSIFLEISVSYFLTRIFASMILYSLMLSRLSISLSRWANLHHFPVFVISPDWHLLFPEKDDIGHNLFKLYLLGLAQLAREG